jgi:HSP20 family protein
LISTSDTGELRQDVQALFDELAASLSEAERGGSGECQPSLDVVESDDAIDVLMDVSGVPAHAIRILFRGEVLVIAGEKASTRATGPRTFHLVEREFGRFARAVRLPGAFDIAGARAELRDGELHIRLPRRSERRSQPHRIAISIGSGESTR